MTRLAVGPSDAPQLDPVFVTAGRAAIAGIFSLIYLGVYRAPFKSLTLVSLRLADNAAPAAFCCAFDLAGIA